MRNPFKPTAGATPPLLVGRQPILDDFAESIEDGPGAPYLLQLMTGPRGVGKTVMLGALSGVAMHYGWIVIHVTARPGMLGMIADEARAHREELGTPARRGRFTAGSISTPLGGGSVERQPAPQRKLTWTEELAALFDELSRHGDTGVCITVDEIHSLDLDQMRSLAIDVQHLIREGRPIALIMAGLPKAVEDLLAGDQSPTTFLRRAERPVLHDVEIDEVARAFTETITTAGRSITDDLAMRCAEATSGYPFMIQLVGQRVWRQGRTGPITAEHVETGIAAAATRIGALVHEPALAERSEIDKTFLVHMATDEGPSKLADIAARMGRSSQYAGVYRDRLIAAGLIRPTGHGYVDFDAPYMREYLRDHATHLLARTDN